MASLPSRFTFVAHPPCNDFEIAWCTDVKVPREHVMCPVDGTWLDPRVSLGVTDVLSRVLLFLEGDWHVGESRDEDPRDPDEHILLNLHFNDEEFVLGLHKWQDGAVDLRLACNAGLLLVSVYDDTPHPAIVYCCEQSHRSGWHNWRSAQDESEVCVDRFCRRPDTRAVNEAFRRLGLNARWTDSSWVKLITNLLMAECQVPWDPAGNHRSLRALFWHLDAIFCSEHPTRQRWSFISAGARPLATPPHH